MKSQKFYIVSRQFGYPIYVAAGGHITDQAEDALVFIVGKDDPIARAKKMTDAAGYRFSPEYL